MIRFLPILISTIPGGDKALSFPRGIIPWNTEREGERSPLSRVSDAGTRPEESGGDLVPPRLINGRTTARLGGWMSGWLTGVIS